VFLGVFLSKQFLRRRGQLAGQRQRSGQAEYWEREVNIARDSAHTPNPSDHYALFYGFPLTEGKTGLKKAKKTAAEAAILFSIRLF
jgi:hypothetical protein